MRRINAASLIELSIDTLRDEIQAEKSLGGPQRYALAMVLSALSSARAEVIGEAEAAEWQLLDGIYDEGEGSMKQLAADIRSKAVSVETHPDLHRRLERLLVADVEMRNPAALRQRAVDANKRDQ